MAEDMTYKPVQTVAQLAARVQELEHQLAQADSNMVALAARNAELAARLDAVPEYVRYLVRWRAGDGHVLDFDEWYTATHTTQPDTDAQIAVLTEDMDWDTIEGAYGEDEHLYGAASEARTWLDGDDPELDATGLAASWESLT